MEKQRSFARRLFCWILSFVLVLSMVPAVFAAEELFDISGSTMTLGNTLEINFVIDTANLAGSDNYAEISIDYADGRGTVKTEIPQSQWQAFDGSRKYVSFCVCAKEMKDQLSVAVYSADGEQLSKVYTDSVADYAYRVLDKSTDEDLKVLAVDMLNYGAAAQTQFGYNTAALANAKLTEEQKALATVVAQKENKQVKGTGLAGSTLTLEENILLNFVYENATIDQAAYAKVSFTNHYGEEVNYTVQADQFAKYDSTKKYVQVDTLVVADCRQLVTVELYNADGEVISESCDSVESYTARAGSALFDNILAFGYGAYSYFHQNENDPGLGDNIIELSTSVSTENGQVVSAASIGEEGVTALIPAGVQVESNTLTLTISEKSASDSGIEAEEGEELRALDIHIDGVSEENTTAIQVYLGSILPAGLNIGNITLYHTEDGVANAMTQVMTLSELDEHNEFYYDPVTGEITVSVASFSEFVVLSEAAKWEGEADHNWYNADATELTIANADQLWSFSQIVGGMAQGIEQDDFHGKTVKLIADIDLNDETDENGKVFYPIGYYNSLKSYTKEAGVSVSSSVSSFEGTFDGNGHTIKNFYQNTWEMFGDYNKGYSGTPNHYKDAMGLFGYVVGGDPDEANHNVATVKNLTIENFSSDGEFTPTGCITAYAKGDVVFENIALKKCNPRVYNTGNGGIVGWDDGSDTQRDTHYLFKNITIDNTNKITALWGSWDVSCSGLLGSLAGCSTAHMENCHVAAQIDAYNDVCGNYQYYWYRYCGMLIGTVNREKVENGYTVPDTTGITAKDCTVHFGDWNNYYYCELVDNSQASYTHDHQFSRLEEVKAVNGTTLTYLDGTTGTVPASGRANYVVVNGDDCTENATCYHFLNGDVWTHDMAGIQKGVDEDGNGQDDLKEDKQHIYLPFNQLFTGYGWGVKNIPIYDNEADNVFAGVKILKRDEASSVFKFESVITENTQYLNGKQVTIGELFKAIDAPEVGINTQNVQVFVSPVNEEDTDIRCIYKPNTSDWTQGTVTLLGEGEAIITITDYFYCKPTTIPVTLTTHDCEICKANGAIPWTVEAYTNATSAEIEAGASSVYSGCYYLANDTVLESAIDLRNSDSNVTICLNGHKLIGKEGNNIYSRIFRIDHGASATVVDGKKSGTLVPRGQDITMGSVAYVAGSGSSLSISDCTIDGSASSINNQDPNGGHRGGAIRMDANQDDADVTLTNVTIKDFKTKTYTYTKDKEEKIGYAWGGALSVSSGIVTIDGCTIQDCTSAYGAAALHLSGGETTISNTTITNCISGGVVEYTPDVVEGNAKYYTGTGAVYVEGKGVLNIEQGTVITGNTSYQEGAAICVEDSSDLDGYTPVVNMYGGDIYGNECKNVNASCGGVRINGVFNMYGGTIHENLSGTTTSSHEILVYEEGTATIEGGTVTHNDTKPGTTINVYRGTGFIKGGKLEGDVNCGFPYYYDKDKDGTVDEVFVPALTISGGNITGNVRSSSSSTTDAPGEVGFLTINDGTIVQGYVIRPANVPVSEYYKLTINGGTFYKDASNLPGYLWNETEQKLYVCEHSFENNGKFCDNGCGYPNAGYVAPEEPTVNDGVDSGSAEPETTEPGATE